MYYFAYGSNMSCRRLQARVLSARKLAVGLLPAHELMFHKIGKDGSAKCDIRVCEDRRDNREVYVYGVVFEIDPAHKRALDRIEGLGDGYEEKTVTIVLPNGSSVTAFTYFATHTDASLRPLDWYRDHVLIGARENGLPADYIRAIELQATREDPDRQRRENELAIYRLE